MFEINDDNLRFSVTPFERITDNDIDPITHTWDWIKVYIEFAVIGLTSQFETSFTVGELTELKTSVEKVQAALENHATTNVIFDSLERQISITFGTLTGSDGVSVSLILRPEGHPESAEITYTFFIDQSYFDGIFARINKMISWQN